MELSSCRETHRSHDPLYQHLSSSASQLDTTVRHEDIINTNIMTDCKAALSHSHTHTHSLTLTHTHTHTHTLTLSHTHSLSLSHTHTHTHVRFCEKWGHPIGVMVFILYKLYVLLPYTNPIPKLSPHRRLCISTFPKKTSLCMIYKRFEKWGHGSMS